ncbi:ATP-binding cassette domain-containing protein [Natronoflexus pectinivorans]|uniref:ABC-type multidrug transport system ATPase subunit n=1 Tax=Natronoflexus pectinivorans TaxID=682526 RepID=A0A4R2GP97_9BACT|nr:ATP-binding cassette domain-containing protein [Natronoflexus pectinivorans]TCO10950.1 ABC-type multidrug transport system ATPase subunit [Natronoflexus pectinivorans]
MSEEILKALMQLFGLLTKQDGGVGSNETEYVRMFLKQQLSSDAVEEYFALFLKHSAKAKSNDSDGEEEGGKVKLTSMKDSVRILGICKKINKQLNREQKIVVLVRLYELISMDMKFTEQRMAIINTVADVFKIPKNEVSAVETFILHNDPVKLDHLDFMLVNDQEQSGTQNKHIQTSGLSGSIIILRIKSADLYFMRYTGDQEIFLNGLVINKTRIYLFPKGSFIRVPKGKPVYYTDVAGHFLTDSAANKISYEVNNVLFRFKNGAVGLRNINIAEEQGRLIGIMGASGAGKTTLLNVLSGIEAPTEGEVLINGFNLHTEKDQIEGVIGLIPQDDLLIEELTVFENLYYNAKLCFKDKNEEEINRLVDDTLQSLGLYERRHLKVGSPLNKMISGGQRKRLNIALELIREPGILFVDEPTSGLSSRDSENVMNLLRELALKGKLIYVVIHQPSSDIYKMFDKMYILDTGGYPVYYGNPGESLIYFKQLDSQINSDQGECPTCGNLNPELIFNIIDASVIDEYGNYTNKRKVSPEEWHEHFKQENPIPEIKRVETQPPKSLNIPSWFNQFKIYTLRDFFSKISNKQYIILNLLEAPFLGFILAYLIRYIADPTSNIYIFRENENIPPYIFMGIVVALFFGLIVSAEEIFKDAKILKRESFLKLSRSSYLASKILLLFTISAIQMVLFVFVGNYILGIQNMYFEFWLALFSISAFANILGLILSASFNSIVTIYILIPLVMIPQMVLGGAMFTFDKLNKDFTSVDKVPAIAEFMPSRYVYEGLIVHQYKHNNFKRNSFEIEMQESHADYKNVHYIPELRQIIDQTSVHVMDEKPRDDRQFVNNVRLLYNELSKEMRRVPEIEFNFIDQLNPENYSVSVANKAHEYVNALSRHYRDMFSRANALKDQFITLNMNQDPDRFNQIKDDHYNESISSIVRREFERNKILRQDNELVQMADPIYQMPEPDYFWSFRTHFFAPMKHFGGRFYETLWFNVAMVWVLTILLYIVLYFDLLKRGIDYFGSIKLRKK